MQDLQSRAFYCFFITSLITSKIQENVMLDSICKTYDNKITLKLCFVVKIFVMGVIS